MAGERSPADAPRLQGPPDEEVERVARLHVALAEAQDRAYWLDRWGLDLNALMRRRGATELRAGLRLARGVLRAAIKAKRRAQLIPGQVRTATASASEETGAPPPDALPMGISARSRAPEPLRASPVTDLLYERLGTSDREELARVLSGSPAHLAEGAEGRRLQLNLGVHHGVPGVLERSGLTRATPPDEVHAMARGPRASGGSLYYADLVTDGLASAGLEWQPGTRALDFGCSSGRVVRVLAAAHPEVEWHGCDPNGDAIGWAQEHLPGVSFLCSPESPPLPYEDGSFSAVFAISVWSQFSAPAAQAWLGEMRRIIRPGGALLLTAQGYGSIAHEHYTERRAEAQLEEVRSALFDTGFWFDAEFGPRGDHGVANEGWGIAFLTPEWLLAEAAADWKVGAFAAGRVEDSQDMYVLERR